MTSPDSRPDGTPSSESNLPSRGAEAGLTRRELRERRLAAEAAVAITADAAITAEAADAAVVAETAPVALTRRQLREQEQADRRRETALRAEELATLEVTEVNSAPLEPTIELVLDQVEPLEHDSHDYTAVEPLPVMQLPAAPAKRPRSRAVTASGRPAQGPLATSATATNAKSSTRPKSNSSRSTTRRGWAKAGLSAVAMTFVLGMTAVMALPSTLSASPVDANVVNLSLNANADVATQQLITANTSTNEVADRDGYGVTDAGELQAAGYSTAQLLIGRSLAQELVNAMDAGKLVGSQPDHMKEIRWIAQGVTVPDCGVDYRVLEIIAIAVRNFDQVGVSDINRKCTGQIEGAGTGSSHYIDGGGHAVDFYLLDNKSLNGSDAGTLKMISLLDPVMPIGSRVGQAGCRASAGVTVDLTNWTEFDDTCTHMHVDVPVTDAPLLLNDDSLLTQ